MVRIFAIELRSQRFGFVLLEGASTLLDWGISGYRRNIPEVLRHKITSAADLFGPFLIVLRYDPTNRPNVSACFKVLEQESRRLSLPLEILTTSTIQKHFSLRGRRNKYEISQV